MRALLSTVAVFTLFWTSSECVEIEIPICPPPDYPESGYYGPERSVYYAGDAIHYFCDTETHIGGSFYRRCGDNGDWIGNAPVCDSPAPFTSVTQSSTSTPVSENEAELAMDGDRGSCTRTKSGAGQHWKATLETPGLLFRVSVYAPSGNNAYEVFMVKRNGEEFKCGQTITRINSLNWEHHNCPEPNNTGVIAVKIRSISDAPLQLCEVVANTITTPDCPDPHFPVENGRLVLTRKRATLACNPGFTKSRANHLDCVSDGVWTRKTLYCMGTVREVPNLGQDSDP